MRYGFDVSNFSGQPTLEAVRSVVVSERFERIIIGCQFPETFKAWADIARQLDLDIGAYLYLYNAGSTAGGDGRDFNAQIDAVAETLQGYPVSSFWLDFEDSSGTLPNEQQIRGAVQHAQETISVPVGIYTSQGYWTSIGNPQLGNVCPLWLASWSLSRPYNFDVWFGGWARATAIQVSGDYHSYGLAFDVDVWDS